MNALPAYEVLKPIAYKGDRIEKGSIIHMDEAEAANIGEEYLKLAESADEKEIPSEPKDTEEAEKSEGEKPADETHTDDTEQKPEDGKPSDEEAPVQTDDKQTETV